MVLGAARTGTTTRPAGADVLTDTWTYPLPASWTDHGEIRAPTTGWDAAIWVSQSQGLVPVGSTMHLYYEAGAAFVSDHTEPSDFGVLTTTTGVTWTHHAGNPIATFIPNGGGFNNPEEGYWYHAVWRRPNGTFTCVFGGQTGISVSLVDISIYVQTSSDGFTWSPDDAAGSIEIIASDDTSFAGVSGSGGEIGATGLWYDEANSLWHMIYLTKASPIWSSYHVQGANLQTLSGANSNAFFSSSANPVGANTEVRPGAIVDRGNGVVDVLVLCPNTAATERALVRIPVLPDYSWTSPGPPEILYYSSAELGIGVESQNRYSLNWWLAANKAVLVYNTAAAGGYDLGAKTATGVRTSDGRLPYTPASARFTSASDQFLTRAGLTGAVDSKLFTISCMVKIKTLNATHKIFRMAASSNTSARFECYVGPLNRIQLFGRNSAGTTILSVQSADGSIALDTWYSIVISVDMASYANSGFYLDRVSFKPGTPSTFTNDLIDFGGCDTTLVGHTTTATDVLNAEVADLGFMLGVWFNLSESRVLNRFLTTSNELQNPGVDGRRMYLQPAMVFLSGNATNFPTNRGTGGAFTLTNGPLTTGTVPPGHP